MTTSKYKMGEPIRACYVKPGTAIMLEPPVTDFGGWRIGRTLRDSRPVIVDSIERPRHGRQTGYVFTCRPIEGDPGARVTTGVLFGQNAIKQAVLR